MVRAGRLAGYQQQFDHQRQRWHHPTRQQRPEFPAVLLSGGPSVTGGALAAGKLTLNNLTLEGGVAQGGSGGGAGMGGAIFNMFGTTTATNCTLAGNTAQGGNGVGTFSSGGSGYGGAIFNLDGTLNLTFCTLAGNTVAGGAGSTNGRAVGGAVYNLALGKNLDTGSAQSATTTVTDSILSNAQGGVDLVNTNGSGPINPNIATVTLNGPNLVMSSTGTIGGSAPLTADPQLGALGNNGGPMPMMALSTSSPTFQTGTSVAGVTTDQRGLSRPATPSLGAFEPQTLAPAPPPAPVVASVQFTSVAITPNLFAFYQTETVNVHVSQGGGIVSFAV